jgi:hypothetical protein
MCILCVCDVFFYQRIKRCVLDSYDFIWSSGAAWGLIYFLICEYFRFLVCILCGKFICKCSLNYILYDTLYYLQNAVTISNAGVVCCGCSVW